MPNRDVPLNEILEFRQRRAPELVLLRNEIESFIAEIHSADDQEEELKRRLAAVDKACSDLIRISHEWQFPVRLTNLKSSFEIRPLLSLTAGAGAFLTGRSVGLSMSEAALSTASAVALTVVPALKLAGDFGWRGLKRRMGPYRYVYQFHNELF